MKKFKDDTEILQPKNQLCLFGYKYYFNSFLKLYEKNELPNIILLSGPKGLGNSTFAYHLTNHLLSKNAEKRYSIENFTINENNRSYKLLKKNIHPNFFLIENSSHENNIKIDQVRNLINFLNKTSFGVNLKIIIIDNVEFLNLYSSNALLKSIEEPKNNTFFYYS